VEIRCASMEIREERPDDVESVAQVHREAFGDHGEVVAALVGDLRPASGSLSLVADDGGRIVGHVLFSPAWLDAPARLVAVQVLSPLGVRAAMHRRGIGTALIHRGAEVLGARGVPAIFLEGDPRYYGRLGFVSATPLGFRKPSLRIPDPAFQVLVLPAHEPWMTGTLVYPDPFWRHDAVGLRD
jgi:putative acetyltransferase